MSLTTADAVAQAKHFTRYRTERVLELANRGQPDGIHGTLLLAIASRETGLRNIVGGGYFDKDKATANNPKGWVVTGEDRGLWQLNERYNAQFLSSVPGCLSGEYSEVFDVEHGGALPKGRVPGLTRACLYVIQRLQNAIEEAEDAGIPSDNRVRVAVAGHNCGTVTAIKAYKDGHVDHLTTGQNYSLDVLDRQKKFRSALKQLRWT